MPWTQIGPAGNGSAVAWSFSNGISTFTQANSAEFYGQPQYFQVATDSAGNISNYAIGLLSPLPPHSVGTTIQFVWIQKGLAIQALNNATCVTVTGGVCTQVYFAGAGTVSEQTESGFFTPYFASSIPTLSEWALLVLAALLGVIGLVSVRRAQL
jgi:hypothetical protein